MTAARFRAGLFYATFIALFVVAPVIRAQSSGQEVHDWVEKHEREKKEKAERLAKQPASPETQIQAMLIGITGCALVGLLMYRYLNQADGFD